MADQFVQYYQTPIGTVEVRAQQSALSSVYFVDDANSDQGNAVTDEAIKQLTEYFAGRRKIFDLPLDAAGTVFQKQVWARLMKIAYGSTCSYADIAAQINNPKAVRAVGAANGKNPLSIIVPCHRVIAANGQLSGYAGGVDRKAWLLAHEFELSY